MTQLNVKDIAVLDKTIALAMTSPYFGILRQRWINQEPDPVQRRLLAVYIAEKVKEDLLREIG
jgi:hypothetical protein